MLYRTLGRSGCAVSALALGTMTFGREADEQESHTQIDRFVEVGGNLIDTADVYADGASEEIIGRWLSKKQPADRDRVVLATKGRFPMGDGPNDVLIRVRHAGVCGTEATPPTCTRPAMPRCAGSTWNGSTSTKCTPTIR